MLIPKDVVKRVIKKRGIERNQYFMESSPQVRDRQSWGPDRRRSPSSV